MLEGKTINSIRHNSISYKNGRMYGSIDLWVTGGIMTIEDEKTINRIDKLIKEAVKNNYDVNKYVQYYLIEEELI